MPQFRVWTTVYRVKGVKSMNDKDKSLDDKDGRYARYNEVAFLRYCFVTVDRAIKHARKEKERRALRYVSIDDVDEALLAAFDVHISAIDDSSYPPVIFDVYGRNIVVCNSTLAIALRSLPPSLRNTLLLEFFAQINTTEIAKLTGVSKRTVERRRLKALKRLHEIIEGIQ